MYSIARLFYTVVTIVTEPNAPHVTISSLHSHCIEFIFYTHIPFVVQRGSNSSSGEPAMPRIYDPSLNGVTISC